MPNRRKGATALAGDWTKWSPEDSSSPNYSGIPWFCETTTNPASVHSTPCLPVSRLPALLNPLASSYKWLWSAGEAPSESLAASSGPSARISGRSRARLAAFRSPCRGAGCGVRDAGCWVRGAGLAVPGAVTPQRRARAGVAPTPHKRSTPLLSGVWESDSIPALQCSNPQKGFLEQRLCFPLVFSQEGLQILMWDLWFLWAPCVMLAKNTGLLGSESSCLLCSAVFQASCWSPLLPLSLRTLE